MYDETAWTCVQNLEELETCGADNIRLVIQKDLQGAEIEALLACPKLPLVRVLELHHDDCAHVDALLSSPDASGVHTVVLGDVWWGDYYADGTGWEEHAVSEALERMYNQHHALEHVVCRGTLPSREDDEYGGTFGFIHISKWWQNLRTLEIDTDALNNDFALHVDGLNKCHSLRLVSPRLTDIAVWKLRNGFDAQEPCQAFELEGHLISREAWAKLATASWLPAEAREVFTARASAPPPTWEQRMGEIRSLTQRPLDDTSVWIVIGLLGKLRDDDDARFQSEVLPYLEALEVWPQHLDVSFGGVGAIHRMDEIHEMLPFLTFSVSTSDPSWSCAKLFDLCGALALPHVRNLECFNHHLNPEEGEAFHETTGWSGLETLIFSTQHEQDPGSLALWITSPHLTSLRHLELDLDAYQVGGDDILDALCAPDVLSTLQELKLSPIWYSEQALERLRASPLGQRATLITH